MKTPFFFLHLVNIKSKKMKKICCFTLFAILIVTGCRTKVGTQCVDITAVKEEITILMDKYLTAYNEKDISTLTTLYADDGLYCGTDPNELIDKKTLLDMMAQVFADTSVNMSYSVEKREIRPAADGCSAIVLEQFIINGMAPKLPVRFISHAVKARDKWMFDFLSWSFIPKNEDLLQ